MSSVLPFWRSWPSTVQRTGRADSSTSVSIHGPIGQNVSKPLALVTWVSVRCRSLADTSSAMCSRTPRQRHWRCRHSRVGRPMTMTSSACAAPPPKHRWWQYDFAPVRVAAQWGVDEHRRCRRRVEAHLLGVRGVVTANRKIFTEQLAPAARLRAVERHDLPTRPAGAGSASNAPVPGNQLDFVALYHPKSRTQFGLDSADSHQHSIQIRELRAYVAGAHSLLSTAGCKHVTLFASNLLKAEPRGQSDFGPGPLRHRPPICRSPVVRLIRRRAVGRHDGVRDRVPAIARLSTSGAGSAHRVCPPETIAVGRAIGDSQRNLALTDAGPISTRR